jgi:flagellin-specific chaperone FliS
LHVSHFARYIKSLAIFSDERQQEIHWLFDSLINSLVIAERNAQAQRHISAATSMRHAKNLMRFLNRSFQDLPDQQLVSHLDDFFNMLERSMDHSMQLPMVEDLEEIRLLVCDLHKGWETLLMPTTSSPTHVTKSDDGYSRGLLA